VGRRPGPGTTRITPEAAVPRLEQLPGISWQVGVGNFLGQVPLYEKMLGRFLSLHALTAQDLRAPLERGDLGAAERTAHSMISAAGTIGAGDLAAAAKALQDAIRARRPDVTGALADRFEAELTKVLQGLEAYLGRKGNQ